MLMEATKRKIKKMHYNKNEETQQRGRKRKERFKQEFLMNLESIAEILSTRKIKKMNGSLLIE